MTSICTQINGEELYYTRYGPTYQMNHTVAIVSESDGWYEVQSTSYLSGKTVTDVKNAGLLDWDWNHYTGWISADEITRINSTVPSVKGRTPTGDPVLGFDALTVNGTELSLSGRAFTPGIYVTEENQITQKLYLQDLTFSNTTETALVSTVRGNDEVSFTGTVDLSQIPVGTYFLVFTSSYSEYPQYDTESYVSFDTVPERFVHQGRVYTFERNDGIVSVTISALDCGMNAQYDAESDGCVCLEGYGNYAEGRGCTVILQNPVQESGKVMQSVEQVQTEENGQLVIQGAAYFDQVNAPAESDVTITLLLVDMETGEERPAETETIDLETPIDFLDGYDYTRVGYRAVIDPAVLDEGNYYLRVRVENGSLSGSHLVISNKESVDQAEADLDGVKFRFYASPMSNYRLEISKEISGIDRSLIRKPTRKASVYAEESIAVSEDAVLQVKGSAFIANTYINEENHPVYALLLEDSSGEIIRFDAQNDGCLFDFAAMRGSKYTIMDSCFTVSADLKGLENGTYRILLDLATDEARDIFSLYNYRPLQAESVTYEGRVYRILKSGVHDRYLLVIEDAA